MEKFPLKGGRSIVTPAYQSVTKKQVCILISSSSRKNSLSFIHILLITVLAVKL